MSFDLTLLVAILVIVASLKYRHVRFVWYTWTLIFFIPIGIMGIVLTLLGIDIRKLSYIERQQRTVRVKRISLRINRAMRASVRPVKILAHSMRTLSRLAKEDEKRARQRNVFNPFAYISVWTPIRSNFRLYRDLHRSIRANPYAAMRGLSLGLRLSNFLSRLGK